MRRTDWPDLLAGGLFLLTGLFLGGYSLALLPLGSLRHMGPGMFPLYVGIGLTLIGAVLAIPALFRSRELPQPDLRSLSAILAGIAAFALIIERLGLIPAIFALVALSSLASGSFRPIRVLVLAGILSALTYGVFVGVLDASLSMLKRPF